MPHTTWHKRPSIVLFVRCTPFPQVIEDIDAAVASAGTMFEPAKVCEWREIEIKEAD